MNVGLYSFDTYEEMIAYEYPVGLYALCIVESSPSVTYVGKDNLFNQINLPVPEEGKVLKIVDGVPTWSTISSGSGGYDGDPRTIIQDSTHRFVTDSEKDLYDPKVPFGASENITAFSLVTSTGYNANSNTVAQRNKIIGINTSNVSSGFIGYAIVSGEITNPSWSWTIGDKIFLNGTDLSRTAPSTGFSIQIGTATGATTINVNIGPSLLL